MPVDAHPRHIVLDSSVVFRLGDKNPTDPTLAPMLMASLTHLRATGEIVSIADLVVAEIHNTLAISHSDPILLAERLEEVVSSELPIFPARQSIESLRIIDHHHDAARHAGFLALLQCLRTGSWSKQTVPVGSGIIEIDNKMSDAPLLLDAERSKFLAFLDNLDQQMGVVYRLDRQAKMDAAQVGAEVMALATGMKKANKIARAGKQAAAKAAGLKDDEYYQELAARLPTMFAQQYLAECQLGPSDVASAFRYAERCDFLGKKMSRFMVDVLAGELDPHHDDHRNDGIDLELDFLLFLPCLVIAHDRGYLEWRTRVSSPQASWILSPSDLHDHIEAGTLPRPRFVN